MSDTNKVVYERKILRSRGERVEQIMKNEQAYAKINELAESLARNVGPTVNIIVDLAFGAEFRDTQTGAMWVYEGAVNPYTHDDVTFAVMELARQPLEELSDRMYMIIRQKISKPLIMTEVMETIQSPLRNPPQVIASHDFVNYFAIGRWVLIEKIEKKDPDEFAQEKNVLRKVQM